MARTPQIPPKKGQNKLELPAHATGEVAGQPQAPWTWFWSWSLSAHFVLLKMASLKQSDRSHQFAEGRLMAADWLALFLNDTFRAFQ